MSTKAPHKAPTVIGKDELVHQVAARSGLHLGETASLLDALAEVVSENLEAGIEVRLMGFGTWHLRNTAKRRVTAINTGLPMQIPASTRVYFKPGAVLAERVKRAFSRRRR